MRRQGGSARALFLAATALLAAASASAQTDDDPDALQAYRDGSFQEAIEITKEEIESNPNNIDSYVVLGWSLNALGRSQEAIDYGLRALQINQFESRVLQIVAEAHYDSGNTLEALGYLERYVRVAPTGQYIDWVYFAMGEIFIELEEFNRADIALSTSVYHNSRSAVRWARLGYAREQLADWEQALAAYDRALQLDPEFADAVRGRQRVRAELTG
ncbi:MAG: tetratricopeptide repeat protein [Spirochaetota bacterium]